MSQLDVIGWREWVYLPNFSKTRPLKTKVDTGARSSALDATRIEITENESQFTVKFRLQFKRQRDTRFIDCEMPACLIKKVRSSSGEEQDRPFIEIPVQLGAHSWTITASLTDRGNMVHRVLLGRIALENQFLVDPTNTYLFGKPATK